TASTSARTASGSPPAAPLSSALSVGYRSACIRPRLPLSTPVGGAPSGKSTGLSGRILRHGRLAGAHPYDGRRGGGVPGRRTDDPGRFDRAGRNAPSRPDVVRHDRRTHRHVDLCQVAEGAEPPPGPPD